jgi:hypothetical protein
LDDRYQMDLFIKGLDSELMEQTRYAPGSKFGRGNCKGKISRRS